MDAPARGAQGVDARVVIALRDVQKVYDAGEARCHALRGVSLEIQRGEFVAIVGASGSGKSTLLNILGCLDRPTEGAYFLAGHDVSDFDSLERAVVRGELLGFVFQGFNLLPRASALENVELPMTYRGEPRGARRERALQALSLVGLAHRVANTPAQLSGGQQQRVAVARALVTAPEVVLADEPTGNLDSRTTEEVLELLQWLNRVQGVTIVMVTHEADVAACASRVISMRDGAVESDRPVPNPRRAGNASRGDAAPGAERSAAMLPRGPGAGHERGLGGTLLAWAMAFRLALRSLARSKLRAALTALGIMIGIAAVVTTSALGTGARRRMETQMASLGSNLLVVMPAGTMTGGARGAQGTVASLTDEDARAIEREVPSVAAVAPVVMESAQVVVGERNASTRVTGTTPGYFTVRGWRAALGELFTARAVDETAAECVLGETVRQALFGRENPIGRDVRVGALSCVVTGVLAARGQTGFGQDQDDTVIVPLSTFRAHLARLPGGQVQSILTTARDQDYVHRAQAAMSALLRQRHRIAPGADDDFSVRNLADISNALNEQRTVISLLLLVVASISLLVGGVGVMNIMIVSVTERTREIGIRLAIGARAAAILAQFLVEAVVLAAIGGVAGLACGAAAAYVIGRATQFSVGFDPSIAALAVGVSCGIGLVFGFFPARGAARLDPIAALRRE